MYNEISDSLSSNLSSIQLNLFDFGSDNAKENVVKRALNQSLIKFKRKSKRSNNKRYE